jgi:hypothetical protein
MTDETFEEEVRRVVGEHRSTRVQFLEEWLEDNCHCVPKHTARMVEGSLDVCEYAVKDCEVIAANSVLWMLQDLHATLFPDHVEDEGRLN